jgi:hypothetical protein
VRPQLTHPIFLLLDGLSSNRGLARFVHPTSKQLTAATWRNATFIFIDFQQKFCTEEVKEMNMGTAFR